MTQADPKDYLANERTFLAWIRTAIGLMAFGFVLERFALFLKQVTLFLDKAGVAENTAISTKQQSYSSGFGILLVGLGALIGFLSFLEYKKGLRQLKIGTYEPSTFLPLATTFLVISLSIFLVIYLLNT